jgi:hypothetical protein
VKREGENAVTTTGKRTAKGEVLAISVPRGETAVLEHFRAQMPDGLLVPDAQS